MCEERDTQIEVLRVAKILGIFQGFGPTMMRSDVCSWMAYTVLFQTGRC